MALPRSKSESSFISLTSSSPVPLLCFVDFHILLTASQYPLSSATLSHFLKSYPLSTSFPPAVETAVLRTRLGHPTFDGGVFLLDNCAPAERIHSLSADWLTLSMKSPHYLVTSPLTLACIIGLCARSMQYSILVLVQTTSAPAYFPSPGVPISSHLLISLSWVMPTLTSPTPGHGSSPTSVGKRSLPSPFHRLQASRSVQDDRPRVPRPSCPQNPAYVNYSKDHMPNLTHRRSGGNPSLTQ